MAFNGKPRKYECLLSDKLYAEVLGMTRHKGGDLELQFISYSDGEEQIIKCTFASYVLIKFYEEMCEYESFIPHVKGDKGGYLQRFGAVLVYENSPYYANDVMGSFFSDGKLPTHYHIVTGDDIIDVLSYDEPTFELEEITTEADDK